MGSYNYRVIRVLGSPKGSIALFGRDDGLGWLARLLPGLRGFSMDKQPQQGHEGSTRCFGMYGSLHPKP